MARAGVPRGGEPLGCPEERMPGGHADASRPLAGRIPAPGRALRYGPSGTGHLHVRTGSPDQPGASGRVGRAVRPSRLAPQSGPAGGGGVATTRCDNPGKPAPHASGPHHGRSPPGGLRRPAGRGGHAGLGSLGGPGPARPDRGRPKTRPMPSPHRLRAPSGTGGSSRKPGSGSRTYAWKRSTTRAGPIELNRTVGRVASPVMFGVDEVAPAVARRPRAERPAGPEQARPASQQRPWPLPRRRRRARRRPTQRYDVFDVGGLVSSGYC